MQSNYEEPLAGTKARRHYFLLSLFSFHMLHPLFACFLQFGFRLAKVTSHSLFRRLRFLLGASASKETADQLPGSHDGNMPFVVRA